LEPSIYIEHEPTRKLLGYSPTELFFRSVKTEWVPETGFSSLPEAQAVIAQYITGYY
jgi:hypothetical protein